MPKYLASMYNPDVIRAFFESNEMLMYDPYERLWVGPWKISFEAWTERYPKKIPPSHDQLEATPPIPTALLALVTNPSN